MHGLLKEQAFAVLRGAMRVLFPLALLGALAPAAMAYEAGTAEDIADCCNPAPPACDAPGIACPDNAQTSTFTAAIAEPGWRERRLTQPESSAAPPPVPAFAGPPAYLRFQRFLL